MANRAFGAYLQAQNRIVIPKKIVEQEGLRPGDWLSVQVKKIVGGNVHEQ